MSTGVEMIQDLTQAEVLTLPEAAAFLRIPPETVERLIAEEALPARKVDGEWRFSKAGLHYWLITAQTKEALLKSAGAFRDDPTLADVLAIIERNRNADVLKDR